MKRLSIIAAIVTLVCCLCMSVSAATENKLTVSVNAPESVAPGEEIELKVDFSENTGFNTLGVKLTYPEGFTYVADSATVSTLIGDEFYLSFAGYEGETYVFNHDEAARTITFVGASLYDVDEASGSLFTAKFVAPATASTGNAFEVAVLDNVYNATGEPVTFTPSNGSTDVVPETTYIKGDVNRNGAVNISDAIWIFGYISGKNNIPDDDTELKVLADVNNNGSVNIADAVAIFNYIAS